MGEISSTSSLSGLLDPLPLSYSLCWGLFPSTIKLKLITRRRDRGLAGQTKPSSDPASSGTGVGWRGGWVGSPGGVLIIFLLTYLYVCKYFLHLSFLVAVPECQQTDAHQSHRGRSKCSEHYQLPVEHCFSQFISFWAVCTKKLKDQSDHNTSKWDTITNQLALKINYHS